MANTRQSWKAFALCITLPLLLTACSSGPKDPCQDFLKTVRAKTVVEAETKADKAIRKQKKYLTKKHKENLKFPKPPSKTCKAGLDPKDPALAEISGKKAKKRAKKASCDIIVPHCIYKPKKPKDGAAAPPEEKKAH